MEQTLNNPIAVLFDLDGVLVDSESIYTRFWADIDRRFPTGVKDFEYVIKGNTLASILDRYFPDEKIRKEILVALKRQEEEMVYVLFPGVIELIEGLRREKIKTAIVTSSNSVKMGNLFRQLPRLGELIDTVITEQDVSRSKPHPEGYLKAAERLEVASERAVVFEDSLAGLEAGRRAGGKVVAVATTNPAEKLTGLADRVVNLASEMTPDQIRNLFI